MITFQYFDQPELFIGFKESEINCDFCGQLKECLDAELFYGREKFDAICPECLAVGKLQDKDAFTCSGDIKELKRQIKLMNPDLSNLEIEQQAIGKTEELEKKTPHIITWQEWEWPCADGDYCQFIGFGSKPFYKRLSAGKPEKQFFTDSFYYNLLDSDFDYLWTDTLPEKEIRNYTDSLEYGTLFYVFNSLKSKGIITIWDCS